MAKKPRIRCKNGVCTLNNLPQNARIETPQNNNITINGRNKSSITPAFNTQNIPLTQQITPLAGQAGPLQGLMQQPYQNQPYMQPNVPIPTAETTAIPQGQVIHRGGQQRGAAGRFFLGSRPEVFNVGRFTPYQEEALNYLLQYGLGGLSQSPYDFSPIANQQLEQFYTQTIPSLAERFTAMGNGQRSSAFQGALGNAGRFLSNDLAALQGQYNLQRQGQLMNLVNLGLTPQFENLLSPGKAGLLPGIVNTATQIGKGLATGVGMGLRPF